MNRMRAPKPIAAAITASVVWWRFASMKERIRAAEAPGSGGSGALTHSDALSTSAEMPTIARVRWSFTRVVGGGASMFSVVIHPRSSR